MVYSHHVERHSPKAFVLVFGLRHWYDHHSVLARIDECANDIFKYYSTCLASHEFDTSCVPSNYYPDVHFLMINAVKKRHIGTDCLRLD
jgi:hypothetical protein